MGDEMMLEISEYSPVSSPTSPNISPPRSHNNPTSSPSPTNPNISPPRSHSTSQIQSQIQFNIEMEISSLESISTTYSSHPSNPNLMVEQSRSRLVTHQAAQLPIQLQPYNDNFNSIIQCPMTTSTIQNPPQPSIPIINQLQDSYHNLYNTSTQNRSQFRNNQPSISKDNKNKYSKLKFPELSSSMINVPETTKNVPKILLKKRKGIWKPQHKYHPYPQKKHRTEGSATPTPLMALRIPWIYSDESYASHHRRNQNKSNTSQSRDSWSKSHTPQPHGSRSEPDTTRSER